MLNNLDATQQTVFVMIGVCVVFMLVVIFSKQLRMLLKIALQGAIGMGAVWVLNLAAAPFGLTIGINMLNAVFIAFLGIPGIVTLYICRMFF